ncbi:VanZ family protein [Metabacillus iocasae]|uniref:Glycopeptide antibiotics resistance protein n=1 Tax=Priestia iocasae TaxID=2291674 RepID=A0ABS2QTN4_9BACI|nr:glycopeptide antibiotics resistance protein [Metabacillus iocasae]
MKSVYKRFALGSVCLYFLYNGQQTSLLNTTVNMLLLLLLSSWIIHRANVKTGVQWGVLAAFLLYLCILHSYVTYIDAYYYMNQPYVGYHTIDYEQINIVPFQTIYQNVMGSNVSLVTVVQTIGNLLLLTPLAFSLLHLKMMNRLFSVLLIIFFTTLGIELTQLVMNYIGSGYEFGQEGARAIDVDDVLLNTLSGGIGIGCYLIYQQIFLSNQKDHSIY